MNDLVQSDPLASIYILNIQKVPVNQFDNFFYGPEKFVFSIEPYLKNLKARPGIQSFPLTAKGIRY